MRRILALAATVVALLLLLAGAPAGSGAAPARQERTSSITLVVRVSGTQAVATGVARPFAPGSLVTVTLERSSGDGFATVRVVPARIREHGRYEARFPVPAGGECSVSAQPSRALRVRVRFSC